ncbi:MAG: PIG-L family deacetylase [Bdellovibrionales bacterium]|nr:PIG-L family deacetylase [Bdellovibrionales bacterium]
MRNLYMYTMLLVFTASLFSLSSCSRHPKQRVKPHENVLLLLAHPDDETMIGTFLSTWSHRGHNISAIYVTAGEGGKKYIGLDAQGTPTFDDTLSQSKLARIRKNELSRALKEYGIKSYTILGQADRPFRDSQGRPSRDLHAFLHSNTWDLQKMKDQIVKHLQNYAPTIVVSMSLDQDVHVHHKSIRYLAQKMWEEKQFGPRARLFLAIDEGERIKKKLGEEEKSIWKTYKSVDSRGDTAIGSPVLGPARHYRSQLTGYKMNPDPTTVETLYIPKKALRQF